MLPSHSPQNIHYSVVRVSREVNVTFKWLLLELKKERSSMLKVIVFCKSITSCVALYKYFLTELREDSYEPPRSTPSTNTRLFAMFHARVDGEDKETILKSFCNPSGICRVIFSTIAFGMGVDVPDVRTVIHFGPSSGIEEYLQESGRAG